MKPGRSQRPRLPALLLAICAHLLAFLALGWRIPKAPPPLPPDASPPVVVQLLRPAPARPATRSASPVPIRARSSPVRPTPAAPTPPPAPVVAPPAPEVAQGTPDCSPEDLPLLTDAEKARCRNQIDADKERGLARSADERAAKQVAAAQRMAPTYRMEADKEDSYHAPPTPGPQIAGHGIGVGVACSQLTFPLLSGVEINPNLFAHKGKQEHKPRAAHHCKATL